MTEPLSSGDPEPARGHAPASTEGRVVDAEALFAGRNSTSEAVDDDRPEPGGPPDVELIARVRAGDVDAMAEIVTKHEPAARRVARSLVSATEADDAVADSFERLWTVLRRGIGPATAIRPYLVQIVRNRAVDVYRRRREYPTEPDDMVMAAAGDPADSLSDSLLVRAALASIPERWSAVLWLHFVEGYDRHEIGRELGLRGAAVSQLLLRAKAGFRRAVANQGVELPDDCARVRALLPRYSDGRTTRYETQLVDDHNRECTECSRAVGAFGRIVHNPGAAIAFALVGGAAITYLAKPKAAVAATLSARSRHLSRTGKTVAVIAVVALAGGLFASALPIGRGDPTLVVRASSAVATGGAAIGLPSESATGAVSSPSPRSTGWPAPVSSASPHPPASTSSGQILAPVPSPTVATTPGWSAPPSQSPLPTPVEPPTASPSPDAQPSPGVTATATPSVIVSPSPDASATSEPSNPLPTGEVGLGQPSAHLRGSSDVPVHLSVPVFAPQGSRLTLELGLPSLTAFEAHHDTDYGEWLCAAEAGSGVGARLRCTLEVGSGTSELGIDLDYPAAQTVTVRLSVAGVVDTTDGDDAVTFDLPDPTG